MTLGQEGRALHSVEEIAASYDAQAAESYATKRENADFFERYGRAVGRELAELKPARLLDAGCGDGVTLRCALREMHAVIVEQHRGAAVQVDRFEADPWGPTFFVVDAIDISEKRLEIAKRESDGRGRIWYQCGSIDNLPYGDNEFDVVFTSHAMEPNGGREAGILYELKRVSSEYVVLFEPDYDAASKEGKARMRRLNYVTNIRGAIEQVGFTVLKDEPFSVIGNELNPTSVFVLRR